MVETGKKERLRALPAVDAVLRDRVGQALAGRHGRTQATAAIREALEGLRREIVAGERPETSERVVATAASRILSGRGLKRVVNATGVVLHTNLDALSCRSGRRRPSSKLPGVIRTWSTTSPPAPGARATIMRCLSSRS